jgi:cell division septation protein DedD
MAKVVRVEKSPPADKSRNSAGRSRHWLVLFLVAAWMFVLGILVGRGTAPVHFDIQALQKELAELREAVLQKELHRYRITGQGTADQAPDLDFYENLKKAPEAQTAVKEKTKVVQKPAEQKGPATEQREPKTAQAPVPAAPSEPPKTAAPPTPAPEAAKPAPEPVRTELAAKAFTIQVASLKEEKAANDMVENLQMKGFPAYREGVALGEKGNWQRVRIGSFADLADATPTLDRLKAAGFRPILVKR